MKHQRESRISRGEPAQRRVRGRLGLALVGAVVAAFAVSACGGSGGEASSGSASGNQAPHVGKKLGIVETVSTPGYYNQAGCGAAEEGRRLGFEVLQPQGPKQFDPAQFNSVAAAVLANNPDALVYMPADAKASIPPVKPAVANGMKLVSVDTRLADPSLETSFVASDHYEGGKVAGKLLVKQLAGAGKVLAVGSIPGNPITVGRIGGFESVVKQSPGIKYLGARYPDIASPEQITAAVAAVIRANPDLKGIYATNDNNAQGAATAVREAGMKGKVKIIDWDAQPIGVKLMRSGDVSGLIIQKPREMGRIAVQQLARALDGKPTQKVIHTSFVVATRDNISSPRIQSLFYDKAC